MPFGMNSGVSGNSEGAAAIRAGFTKSRSALGSGRQFLSLKDQMKYDVFQANIRDQERAAAQTYINQGETHKAELGDIRATRDTARAEYVAGEDLRRFNEKADSHIKRFNDFRTANPETANYNMTEKGGFSTSMAAMGKPQTRQPKPGQTRTSLKQVQGMVASGELSEAEAAGRYGHYAKYLGTERAKDNAGKKPAPIRQGVSYVAGDKYDGGGGGGGGGSVPRQFTGTDITTNVK